jgi:prophage antirepressor-like protein
MIHSNQATSHPIPPPGTIAPPFALLTEGPAITSGEPAASPLIALSFTGTGTPVTLRAFRCQNGFAWFVLADIHRALGKFTASGKVKAQGKRQHFKKSGDIAMVRAWVTNTASRQNGGYAMLQALSERGLEVFLLAREATDQALALRYWVTETAVPIVRTV